MGRAISGLEQRHRHAHRTVASAGDRQGAIRVIAPARCGWSGVVNCLRKHRQPHARAQCVATKGDRGTCGAGRVRLLRQLLTESITLSLLGGAAGVLVGSWGVQALLALNPIPLPRYNHIGLDLSVLLFTLAASIITGIVFGLAPAWQSLKLDLHTALKEGGRTAIADSGQRRLSSLL